MLQVSAFISACTSAFWSSLRFLNCIADGDDLYIDSLIKETEHSAVFNVSNEAARYVLKIFKFSNPRHYHLSGLVPAQERTNAFYFAESSAYSSLQTKSFAQHMPAILGHRHFTKSMERAIAKDFHITWNRVDQTSILHGIVLQYISTLSSKTFSPPLPTDTLRTALRSNLKQLHEDGICHNDIKADNLLFDQITQKMFWIDFSSATRWNAIEAMQDRISLEQLLNSISESRQEPKDWPEDLSQRSFRDEFSPPPLIIRKSGPVPPPVPPPPP